MGCKGVDVSRWVALLCLVAGCVAVLLAARFDLNDRVFLSIRTIQAQQSAAVQLNRTHFLLDVSSDVGTLGWLWSDEFVLLKSLTKEELSKDQLLRDHHRRFASSGSDSPRLPPAPTYSLQRFVPGLVILVGVCIWWFSIRRCSLPVVGAIWLSLGMVFTVVCPAAIQGLAGLILDGGGTEHDAWRLDVTYGQSVSGDPPGFVAQNFYHSAELTTLHLSFQASLLLLCAWFWRADPQRREPVTAFGQLRFRPIPRLALWGWSLRIRSVNSDLRRDPAPRASSHRHAIADEVIRFLQSHARSGMGMWRSSSEDSKRLLLLVEQRLRLGRSVWNVVEMTKDQETLLVKVHEMIPGLPLWMAFVSLLNIGVFWFALSIVLMAWIGITASAGMEWTHGLGVNALAMLFIGSAGAALASRPNFWPTGFTKRGLAELSALVVPTVQHCVTPFRAVPAGRAE